MKREKMVEKIARRLKRVFGTDYLPLTEAEVVLDLVEKFGMAPPIATVKVDHPDSWYLYGKKYGPQELVEKKERTWDYE